MGAERHVRDETSNRGNDAAESRTVQLAGGMRWRASVVARLVSEDVAAGRESARLIVHLECLSAPRRAIRAAVAGARSLAEVSDADFERLIAHLAARHTTAAKSSR